MLVENKILPKEITELFNDVIDSSYQKITSKEKKIIYESLVIAFNGHDGQLRKSGEPYIYHPLEVAKIVAKDIGLDYMSIAAAILHDILKKISSNSDLNFDLKTENKLSLKSDNSDFNLLFLPTDNFPTFADEFESKEILLNNSGAIS